MPTDSSNADAEFRSSKGLDCTDVSIVIPARNESVALQELLPELRRAFADAEIIVVNDGSTDQTRAIAEEFADRIINHPYPMGNGAAIKSGARAASRTWLAFMDGDGQHTAAAMEQLLVRRDAGFDMLVGSRNRSSQANFFRQLANGFYNKLASFVSGHKIADLTSGIRLARRHCFRPYLGLLPNGFSYPTTITMCFLRSGYPVGYFPVEVKARVGRSHIRPLRDGFRFILIIFRIAALYSPLKLFVPVSFSLGLAGLGYYAYTYLTAGRFTNMSMLLLSAALIVFMMGLLSEQITNLTYLIVSKGPDGESRRNRGAVD